MQRAGSEMGGGSESSRKVPWWKMVPAPSKYYSQMCRQLILNTEGAVHTPEIARIYGYREPEREM